MNTILIPNLSFDDTFRFWSHVDRKSKDCCWNYILTRSKKKERPKFGIGTGSNKRNYYAARVSYFLEHKVDPGEELVLHTCNNDQCVNPHHLYLGNHHDNKLDFFADGGTTNYGNAKINSSMADAIRQFARDNPKMSQRKIGEIFDLSQPQISKILRKEVW